MIKVYIIDDHQLILDGIKNFLNPVPNIQVVGSNQSPKAALVEVINLKPDIALVDISMTEMNGLDWAKNILEKQPEQKIIILSTHEEISIIKKAMKLGVKGYLSKSTSIEALPEAINKVHAGEIYLGKTVSQVYMDELIQPNQKKSSASVIPTLTNREKEVLQLIAQEYTTVEIGQRLFISVNTVESHRRSLLSKFGVKNSVGLIKKAIEFGFIEI